MLDDAKLVVVAFGIAARIARGAIKNARKEGLKVGMLRPITLWPFPSEAIVKLAKKKKHFLDIEMNMGQMLDDVKLSLEGAAEVSFYGRTGGVIPTPAELQRAIARVYYQKGLKGGK
jgi:2-oxoglutarate ferredoxin oxidoreductase subunit alpha